MSPKLKSIDVHNYKSFQNTRIDFDNFNVIVGANNAGKTNLIDLLEFIDLAIRNDLVTATKLKGGFRKIKNFRSTDDYIDIKTTFISDGFSLYFKLHNSTIVFKSLDKSVLHFKLSDNKIYLTEANIDVKITQKTYSPEEFREWRSKWRDITNTEIKKVLENLPDVNFSIELKHEVEEIRIAKLNDTSNNDDAYQTKYKKADIYSADSEGVRFGRGILHDSVKIKNNSDKNISSQDFLSVLRLFFGNRLTGVHLSSSGGNTIEDIIKKLESDTKPEFYLKALFNNQFQTFNFNIDAIRNIVKTPESLTLKKNGENLHYILESLKNLESYDSDLDTFSTISSAISGAVTELEKIDIQVQPMGTDKVPEIFFKEKNDFLVSRDVISDGTLHLLAILTGLYSETHLFLLTAFEEPERHLHMNAVSYLMELFRDRSKSHQLLITTQSSEVMRNIDTETDHLIFIYRDHDGNSKSISARDIKEIGTMLEEYDYNIDEIIRNEVLGYLGDYEQKK
jgi:predicted ATPase